MSISNILDLKQKKLSLLREMMTGRSSESNADQAIRRRASQVSPLSFAQQRLWLLNELIPDSPIYNVPVVFHFRGRLDAVVLQRSLNEIVRRHDILRTSFLRQDSDPVQLVASSIDLSLEVIDLSSLPEADRQRQARQIAQAEAREVFDLTRGPLLRATLLRLGEQEHWLLLTMHHIITDAWSVGIILRELAQVYEAFLSDSPSPLRELAIQYSDFAHWQRNWMQGQVLDEQLSYWKLQLDSIQPLQLPSDKPRPAARTFVGQRLYATLPQSLVQALDAFSRREGVTLYMTLLAAFSVLLSRYSNQLDIALGSPIANRNRGEIEDLVGFFVNTLVIRTDLSGDPTFSQLLRRVREVTLAAYAHQDLPFEKLVEELHPQRDLSQTPLFQVMFVLQNAPLPVEGFPGLTVSMEQTDLDTSKFDLTFSVVDWDRGLIGLEYSSELFDHSTIERMLTHLQNLLVGIVAHPDRSISLLPMLNQHEQQTILKDWNSTARDYPHAHCVHESFERQVELSPDSAAVVFQGQQLSYDQLNRRANQLAHYLREEGVGAEVLVGLCVERSMEMVVGLLGILKAGGAYLPLDPSYPAERLQFMLRDSKAQVLLTQRNLARVMPWDEAKVVLIDESEQFETFSDVNVVTTAAPMNLAYVMYTSGSTGRPKGVAVTHRNVIRLVSNNPFVRMAASEVFLQFAPISFDASTFEIWGALLNGAKLAIAPPGLPSLQDLGMCVRQHGVSTLWLTASLFRAMVDEQVESLVGVRQLLAGGDVLPPAQVRRAAEELPSCRITNGYGPTENTTFSCCHTVDSEGDLEKIVPIGRPIANTTAYILDRMMQPVPVGVPGEIYVGGDGLARGYLNQPDLTAERFLPNPFAYPGSRLYRTGDLARFLLDGSIEFLGRNDHQVKLRGFRIELAEVEARLLECPALREAIVLLREETPAGPRLVAYLTAAPGRVISVEQLRCDLKRKLPSYMIPSAFVVMDAFPLTPTGKLDRRALPAPDDQPSQPTNEFAPPRDAIEETLIGLWGEILGVRQIGIYDNWFDLGGHSLLATQLVSRLREAFQLDLPVRSLFEAPTVAGLGRVIEEVLRSRVMREAPPMVRVADPAGEPLSFAQQRLWFLNELIPDIPLYNVPAPVSIRGHLDLHLLNLSLNEIVRRHDILRTSFLRQDSDPVQLVASSIDLSLEVIDLSSLPETDRQRQARQIAQAEAREVFDLTRGPLLRATLLRLGEQEHWLLLTMHHIITDGWSVGIILRELAQVYEAFLSDSPSPLRELAIQYGDFAHWQRNWMQGQVLDEQLSYWKRQLDSIQPLQLPTDKPRLSARTYAGATHNWAIAPTLVEQLKALSRREGVTLYMTLLAAFSVLLSRYSNQLDIALGSPIANRNRGEIEDLVGFFVNTLVIRTDLSGDPTFSQLLRRVREVTLAAYAHQDLPFEKLVEELHPQRDLSQTPLFQAVFAMQNFPLPLFSTAGLSFEPVEIDTTTAKFDLNLAVMPVEDRGLLASLEYSAELFEHSTIEQLVSHLQNLLAGILDDPLRRIGDLPLLSEQERRLILVDWNSTASDYRPERCVHELFQAQAERSPQAVAVVYENQQLSYDELNRRANQLAHCLRGMGVGPEVLVGLCVERSLDMVIGLLGILKAGGAYVPLDPSYPAERLEIMLRDCGARVLVTHSHLQQKRPGDGAQVIYLDEDWPLIAAASDANPKNLTLPENLAYVIYTSGSTGTPKGVGIQHSGLVNLINCHNTSYQINPKDRASHFSALGFDGTGWEVWPYLVAGARVQLMDEQTRTSAEAVHEFIIGNSITRAFLPPVLSEVLLQRSWPENTALRTLLTGGDRAVLYPPLGLPFEYWNHYGPTEATVTATRARVDTQMTVQGPPAIGRPLDNFRIFVLDSNLEPVPPLVAGELYIAGVGLARGYLSAPALTAEKFIPDPHTGEHGARMYRTGDVARYRPDGILEFLGRNDHQVKLRGFRIELGEIEARLKAHAAVHNAIAVVHGEGSEAMIVAYVVPVESSQLVEFSELRGFLAILLPQYMIPAAFVLIEEVPITPNGKVDLAKLPPPERVAPTSEIPTPLEQELVDIWSSVLEVEKVGIHDNFFGIGGHSLLASLVIFRIQEVFGITVPVRTMFEAPTIAELSIALGQMVSESADSLPDQTVAIAGQDL